MRFGNQRGQIIIFTLIAVIFLLMIAGSLPSDVARMIASKNEVQTALDAAALAGAGKLGFDNTVFPTARTFAVNFAAANKTRSGT
jgi:Flp pilus assembly protein TadG